MQILLSNSQAGRGRTVKQEHEEISCNHVQAFILGSVLILCKGSAKEIHGLLFYSANFIHFGLKTKDRST